MLQAASSTGTAIEQLAKTLLVSINPALLADKGHPSSVLVLSGHTALARREPINIKTIQLVKHCNWSKNYSPAFLGCRTTPPLLTLGTALYIWG